jgi:hypothetical protein
MLPLFRSLPRSDDHGRIHQVLHVCIHCTFLFGKQFHTCIFFFEFACSFFFFIMFIWICFVFYICTVTYSGVFSVVKSEFFFYWNGLILNIRFYFQCLFLIQKFIFAAISYFLLVWKQFHTCIFFFEFACSFFFFIMFIWICFVFYICTVTCSGVFSVVKSELKIVLLFVYIW